MNKGILIAESGSTKTDWRLCLEDGSIKHYSSIGLNPYFIKSEELEQVLLTTFGDIDSIKAVYFYGAGCSNKTVIKTFYSSFSKIFKNASIEINHDLLAAARSLFHKEKGMAIIFGTGSNSCLYDGKDIIENIPALGFILGDEGSGADMGKRLVSKFIHKTLNSKLINELDKITSKEEIFESVYKTKFPNKYLASFSKFIAENIDDSEIEEIVIASFEAYFDNYVLKYKDFDKYPIGIVGSLGKIYTSQIKEVAANRGLNSIKFLPSPIEELVKYHLS